MSDFLELTCYFSGFLLNPNLLLNG